MMTCVICDLQDKVVSCVSQFQVRQCKACGYYGMPEELVEKLQATGQRLNVERTKAFLSSRKQNQQPPWISVEDALENSLLEPA
jgi:NMD protein affecting ribosome stability and mRNA decay